MTDVFRRATPPTEASQSGSRPAEAPAELEFQRNDEQRLKARIKARLLGRPELAPRLGRFTLVRRLGQGAHGVVYEAEDTRSGATVALKLLRDPHASNVMRFKQEFRGLSHLAHENLVQLHELFLDGDEWFFSMELVRGLPFTEYVCAGSGENRYDVVKLRGALTALFGAVQAIHEAGRLHCDLKPSNVLVTAQGRVVVLDFGLVSALTDPLHEAAQTRFSALGTPTYMAPELLQGNPPTPATDAYAIGVMLSQVLPTPSSLQTDQAEAPSDEPDSLLRTMLGLRAGLLASDPAQRLTVAHALAQLGGAMHAEHVRGAESVPSHAFVGRKHELAVMREALSRARAGAPVALFVHGSSGIGKTTLCERFVAEVSDEALVLSGRCHERESLPYKAFDGLIDALARTLRGWPSTRTAGLFTALDAASIAALLRLFPSLRDNAIWPGPSGMPASSNPTELRQQAFAALKKLLHHVAAQQPLVLWVDDLQWADLDSARLLLELLGPPAAPALLYIGSYRREETARSEFLREILGSAAGRWQCHHRLLAIDALPQVDAHALAAHLLGQCGAQPALAASRIARDSAGVPFLVSELARHFATAPRESDAVPSLSDLLSQRVAALSPSARRALGLLALAGRPVAQRLLERALANDASWERALRMLSVAGLIRTTTDGELVVYHDRLREQVIQLLSEAETLALHRTLAFSYESVRESEPEWLIEHFCGAGDAARALDYAVAAADLAADKLAFNRAAALYGTALRLSPTGDPRTSALRAKLGDALVNAGRGAEAAAALLEAAEEHADEEAALAMRCRAVQQLLRSGRSTEGHALLRQLLHDVGISYPENEKALYARIALSQLRLFFRSRGLGARASRTTTRHRLLVLEAVFRECAVADPLLGALFQSLFHEEALLTGSAEAEFMALAWDTYTQAFLGGFGARRSTARRIGRLEQLAEGLKSPYAQGTLAMIRCAAALFEARHAEVDGHGRAAQEVFGQRCLATYWEESVCATLRYSALEVTGPVSALCEAAPKLLRRANESSDHFSEAVLSRTMSLALLAQNEPRRALAFLSERLLDLGDHFDLRSVVVTMSIADSHSYAGHPIEAWHAFERSWRPYMRSLLARSQYLRLVNQYRRGRLAISFAAVTDDREARRIAASHARALERMRWPIADVFAATLRAALAFQRGDSVETLRLLRATEQAALRLDMTMFALCLKRQLGGVSANREGPAVQEQADAALRAQGVLDPARWMDMLLPSGVVGVR